MSEEDALLAAIVRSDFAGFVERCFLQLEPGTSYAHSWHVEGVAYELMRVFRGKERRLIINLPPALHEEHLGNRQLHGLGARA